MEQKRIIMDEKAVARAIARISYEIIERNKGTDDLCIVGIFSRGVPLGKRIADKLSELEKNQVPFGALDITPYRDDGPAAVEAEKTNIPFDITDKNVVIVDDVIFTGRSSRAAIDALIKRGRPRSIQLAVLIDRGHRELPIAANFVGKNVPTARDEFISVRVSEIDGRNEIALFRRDA
jgi:pyrimidine operon attenuation protein/uracil phosphoribosyltransferase